MYIIKKRKEKKRDYQPHQFTTLKEKYRTIKRCQGKGRLYDENCKETEHCIMDYNIRSALQLLSSCANPDLPVDNP